MKTNLDKFNENAEILKALAHPIRLCIVSGLLNKKECNVNYMRECLDLPQSTVSQHLQKLKSAGIIKGERKGTEIFYTVVCETSKKIVESILNAE